MFDPNRLVKKTVSHLTKLVTTANHTLDLPGLIGLFDLYQASEHAIEIKAALVALAPEFQQVESLQVLDPHGDPQSPGETILAKLRELTLRAPGFESWLAPVSPEAQESRDLLAAPDATVTPRSGVLAARWLCHLVGLRHATVELFIDHPTLPGFTLLQVRSYQKASAPGCFDLPVAGHVDAGMSNLDGLIKESREELGLDLAADGGELAALGSLESGAFESGAKIKNIEYRFVYRCILAPEVWLNLRPDPAEVAGLAIFSIEALQDALMRDKAVTRQARRFASGIREALPLYLALSGLDSKESK